ncbi:MAG: hypothetical protein OCD76_11745 [Reichenbachiella sp.]
MKKLLIIGVLLSLGFAGLAQPGWNWPQNVEKAKEYNALYVDAVKSSQFATAIEPHQWLLDSCPDLNESLYINGAKIYEGLYEKETDAAKKTEYADKAMLMYDMRIEYFGNEGKVLNRKAFKAYKYYKGDKTKYQELYELFNKTFELNGNKTLDNNIIAYMDIVRRFKLSGGEISDDEVINKYGYISEVISAKDLAKPNPKYVRYQETIDKMLIGTVDIDCAFIEEKLVPKMRESKDPKMAKKVFKLMISAKCLDSDSFVEAGEIVFESEKDYGIAKILGIKLAAAKKYDKAIVYYDAAIELTDDNLKKGEIHLKKARMYNSMGQKSNARTSARKAMANDPSVASDAYTMIGNLYMASYEGCRAGESKVDDRLVYIAAFNQYKKAGNTSAMSKAKAQFPSISEIFELGLQEGQSMSVGCWINETVSLARRPN